MGASYLQLTKEELKKRARKAWSLLAPCSVCPHQCGVDRIKGQKTGFCKMGKKLVVSSAQPHFGEENCLVGQFGSGTIFFSSCNLSCVFCQNYYISQLRKGEEISLDKLADLMLNLQDKSCHNINLVSPSIWVPQILKALIIARDEGLKTPLVYNTGGYDSVRTLKLLDGIVDIYMPDIKYSSNKIGQKYSGIPNYWMIVKKAVKEMYQQVGDLKINEQGIAEKGVLIRHLVLPNNWVGTEKVMKFIASLSKDSYLNIMDQYRPCYRADEHYQLNRRITKREYNQTLTWAKEQGLHRFEHV